MFLTFFSNISFPKHFSNFPTFDTAYLKQNTIISFHYVEFWPKSIYLILYPFPLETWKLILPYCSGKAATSCAKSKSSWGSPIILAFFWRLQDISTPEYSTPSFNPKTKIVEKSRVEKLGVKKSWVEISWNRFWLTSELHTTNCHEFLISWIFNNFLTVHSLITFLTFPGCF